MAVSRWFQCYKWSMSILDPFTFVSITCQTTNSDGSNISAQPNRFLSRTESSFRTSSQTDRNNHIHESKEWIDLRNSDQFESNWPSRSYDAPLPKQANVRKRWAYQHQMPRPWYLTKTICEGLEPSWAKGWAMEALQTLFNCFSWARKSNFALVEMHGLQD